MNCIHWRCLASEREIPADVSGEVREEQSCRLGTWQVPAGDTTVSNCHGRRGLSRTCRLHFVRLARRLAVCVVRCSVSSRATLRAFTEFSYLRAYTHVRFTMPSIGAPVLITLDVDSIGVSSLRIRGFVTLSLERVASKPRPSAIFHSMHAPTARILVITEGGWN